MTRDVPVTGAAGMEGQPETVAGRGPGVLDDVDRALVERLRHDGRETNRSLAQALGISEVTVAARLRRMEQNAIMRVVAVTDMQVFGHREFAFAFFTVAKRSALEVGAELAKLPEVIAVTISTGRYDLIAPLLGRDQKHLAELFGSTLAGIAGVDEVRGLLALDVLKFDSRWALLAADSGTTPEAQPSETVDELDLSVIRLLQIDARRSNRSIAAELGVSEGTIRARVKRLISDRVIRIQAISDVYAFGIGAHAYVGIVADGGAADDLGRRLAARDDVVQLSRTLGEFDFVAVLIGNDRAGLASALINEIAVLPGLRRTETFETYTSTKHTYEWSWIV
ncbi:Lrp/AsnC family transcriptional regulator [Nocardia nepalensis]|uniref:Lrp/AsnC family transcriptional regulator n=1 Tax=Nocardia nepalensis TaxID=3375448 RepID=UPI003B678F06